jgi:hypothetical protein
MPFWTPTPDRLLRRLLWRRRFAAARVWEEAARQQRAEHEAAVAAMARLSRLAGIDPAGHSDEDRARAWAIYDDGLRAAAEWQEEARRDVARHDPAVRRILDAAPRYLDSWQCPR